MKRLNEVALGNDELTDKAVVWWSNLSKKQKREATQKYGVTNTSWYDEVRCSFIIKWRTNGILTPQKLSLKPDEALRRIYTLEHGQHDAYIWQSSTR
jgi:hypothetical protein